MPSSTKHKFYIHLPTVYWLGRKKYPSRKVSVSTSTPTYIHIEQLLAPGRWGKSSWTVSRGPGGLAWTCRGGTAANWLSTLR